MSEANKAVLRRLFQEVVNAQNPDLIDEFYAPNYVRHGSGQEFSPGPQGVKEQFELYTTAFPDLKPRDGAWHAHGCSRGHVRSNNPCANPAGS